MSEIASEISQLANILHKNGDKVLNALSKLSLNAVLLQKLNREFEVFLENLTNSEESFQVIASTHGNSQILKDLHFLHDFIQKATGLKLTNNTSLPILDNKIDISKFKNIKYLEIKKIPIKEIIGLQSIQSQLQSIICIRCLSSVEDLLSKCGGDNSSGIVWSELAEAVLSFNHITIVDTSIALAPWLRVLDLSHNQITDVKAIECLPNLKYVNLSFNCLSALPTFNKSARKKIELLVIKNNYIEDLSGLQDLSHLIELDLTNNWITNWESLESLLLVSNLQWLSMAGNPISCHNNYRQKVAGYLHISASFSDFYLDKIKLSKKEKAIVGIQLCAGSVSLSNSSVAELSRNSFQNKFMTKSNHSEEQRNTTRKSGKTRVVAIPNLDDGTYEETENDNNSLDLMTSSTEHLITKKRIENTRSAYGIDNWLVHGSSVVEDILGLPPVQVSFSTPCDDLCFKAALDSVKNIVTTVAIIENQERDSDDGKKNHSLLTSTDGDNTSNYFSAETSGEKEEVSSTDREELMVSAISNEALPDLEEPPETEEVEEIDIDENEKLFLVLKEGKNCNNEVIQEEMFLKITENEILEGEASRGRITAKWSLSSLESCIKLKSDKLQLMFDTIRRDKRERIYLLEEKEAIILYKQLTENLESRALSDMNQLVYECGKCNSQFSLEIKSKKSNNYKCCPFCQSKFILQTDEVPLPTSETVRKTSEMKNSKSADLKVSHNRSSSVGGFFQSLLNQNENKILKCSSQSSIGSAASLDKLDVLPTIPNSSVKRSDSDIEILSNPSQSSIEVIEGPGRTIGGSSIRQKRSSEEKQDVQDPVTAIDIASQNNPPAGLTESSSSGSVTDSICTTYESSSAATGNRSESSAGPRKEVQGTEVKTDPVLQEVLNNFRKTMKETKKTDGVKYSYSDFTNVDHRIKLFLYTHVFNEPSEEFSFALRATVSPVKSNASTNFFPSCIIASSKNLYFLKVINSELGDDARSFLQKVDSLCFNLSAVTCIFTLTWYQGFGIKIKCSKNKWKQYLILLMDAARTKNFLKFLTSIDTHGFTNAKIVKETLQRPYWSIQHLLLSSASLEDTSIQFFCLFKSCSIRNALGETEFHFGGVLTNSTELLLIVGNLNWLYGGADQPPTLKYFQKFKNLVQIYTNQSIIILQFFDGIKETDVWSLCMEGDSSAEELLKSIRESWEKLCCIPLQLSAL